MTRRRIVIVTYFFPPSTYIGGARLAAMAAHLRAMGHDVRVVTTAANGAAPHDPHTVRTGDLAVSPALRRLLRRPVLPETGTAPAVTPAPAVLTRVVVPDSHVVSWLPAAGAALRDLRRGPGVDCVITSGPPHSTHLLGLGLGRSRPAWLADFRDGWTFEPLHEAWPTALQRRLDAELERRVARGADVVIGATLPIAEDLRDRFGVRAEWVPNGWDPHGVQPSAVPPGVVDDGWATLVHTGTLTVPANRRRNPLVLLDALRDADAARKPGDRRVRLVLAGRRSAEDDVLVARGGDLVQHLGMLDRPAALALQRAADALLLLTGTNRSEATGKLFEYLAAGRPVLAIAKDNEAARIVQATHTGVTVAPDDAAGLVAVLRRLAADGLRDAYAPRDLERFTYPAPARRVADLVEAALRRRRAAR